MRTFECEFSAISRDSHSNLSILFFFLLYHKHSIVYNQSKAISIFLHFNPFYASKQKQRWKTITRTKIIKSISGYLRRVREWEKVHCLYFFRWPFCYRQSVRIDGKINFMKKNTMNGETNENKTINNKDRNDLLRKRICQRVEMLKRG